MEVKYEIKGLDGIFTSTDNYDEISNKIAERLTEENKTLKDPELDEVIEDFTIYGEEDGSDYFDLIVENMYDWADHAKVWISVTG